MAARIESSAVNVADTAGGTLLAAEDPQRRVLIIHNNGAADIFVGPSGVSILTGILIPPDEKLPFYTIESDQTATQAFYAIAAATQTSPNNTRVFESFAL